MTVLRREQRPSRVTGTADNGFTVVEVPELAMEDDDTAPTEITLGVVPDRLIEGSGETPVTVIATLGMVR